jgi:hypothetical protein
VWALQNDVSHTGGILKSIRRESGAFPLQTLKQKIGSYLKIKKKGGFM